jgi:hypothetical protein
MAGDSYVDVASHNVHAAASTLGRPSCRFSRPAALGRHRVPSVRDSSHGTAATVCLAEHCLSCDHGVVGLTDSTLAGLTKLRPVTAE